MREIKFRAWGKFNNKETEYMLMNWQDSEALDYTTFDGGGVLKIMQYTGLHDKNGKEIYEGDLVKYFDQPIFAQVVYDELSGAFRLKGANGWQESQSWFSLTVIGNLYSNPELLEVKP